MTEIVLIGEIFFIVNDDFEEVKRKIDKNLTTFRTKSGELINININNFLYSRKIT